MHATVRTRPPPPLGHRPAAPCGSPAQSPEERFYFPRAGVVTGTCGLSGLAARAWCRLTSGRRWWSVFAVDGQGAGAYRAGAEAAVERAGVVPGDGEGVALGVSFDAGLRHLAAGLSGGGSGGPVQITLPGGLIFQVPDNVRGGGGSGGNGGTAGRGGDGSTPTAMPTTTGASCAPRMGAKAAATAVPAPPAWSSSPLLLSPLWLRHPERSPGQAHTDGGAAGTVLPVWPSPYADNGRTCRDRR